MVTTDLGACEWFVWDLRRSNLLDRGQLDQVVGEFLAKNPRAEPPALADDLVRRGILTRFQADRLLQGKTQGFVLGPFTLMDALGTGSMGTVYKALSKNDNQWYAVKVLPRRSMWNVRIARRKVRAFEQCRHPTVVPFVEVGTSGGMHYLAWPLVEGETLDRLIQRQGRLRPGQATAIALEIAEGLDVCHQQGLFHGLLKPSNVMIGPSGPDAARQPVYILDFGIGSLLAESEEESLVDTMSTANAVSSGLDCASPESIMDPTNLTPLGDQYSLGCVLYYCLAGRYPFPEGETAVKMLAIQTKQPVPIRELVPEVPEALAAVVERLMQKAPEARYGSSAEVIEALQPVARAAGASPVRVAPAPPPPAAAGNGHADKGSAGARSVSPSPAENKPRPARVSGSQLSPRVAIPPSALPSRQSLHAPSAGPVPSAPNPSAAAPVSKGSGSPAVSGVSSQDPQAGDRPVHWEERFGPLGLALAALVVWALAWLLSWKLF